MKLYNNILPYIQQVAEKALQLLLALMLFIAVPAMGQGVLNHITSLDKLGTTGNYVLDNDISDASAYTSLATFRGTLDGAYHTISGLTQPLFTTVNGGTVKNLVLDKVHIASGTNVGAVCGTATGSARIYNCGVQSSDGSSSLAGTTVGGLVGTIDAGSSVRVVNCYNYATVSGTSYSAGIVGRNQGTVSGTTTVNTTGVRIAMCMMYGDITGGTNRSPVYGGNHTNNVQKLTEYNYWRSRANLTYTAYNDQLAIDKDEYLTRFPFYRHILNTHRELAACFLFGTGTDAPSTTQVDEIGHWVLLPDVAPYPILEPWAENTHRTTQDIATNLPTTTADYAGRLLTEMGSSGYLAVTVKIGTSTYNVSLPITDMDTARYDFTWGKVVLPFANELWTQTDYSKVVTGWKITSVTKDGSTLTTFNIPAGEPYNFADRDNAQKDIYNATNNPYIFAQGGNYIVPYGVTAITIEANLADAFYLSDAYADFGYNTSYGGQTNLGWQMPTKYHGRTVYTNLSTLVGDMSTSANPHAQAIVLVGNYHYNQRINSTIFATGKACTIMSIDDDNNQEPDYGWYSFHTTDRTEIPALRFDFVPNIGIGMAGRVTGSNPNPTIGIWHSHGWFELTETCVSFMSECEVSKNCQNANDDGHGNNRWIANSGYFKQIVYTRSANATKMSYVQIGGNAYVEQFYPGPHVGQNNSITFVPVNVTGGEVEQCFMTGKGQNSSAKATGDNIRFWCAGGRIHKYLSAYMVVPSSTAVNVTAKIDHAVIRRFFGGGTSQTARITGNIDITVNNSLVGFYCGGPEFGNMNAGKTVTTHATNTTFGEYYGAGFGGTAITWQTKSDVTKTFNSDLTYTEPFTYYTNDRLKYTNGYGYGTCYDFDFIMYAGGGDGNNANGKGVARFYTGYADFSLAQTGDVTNILDRCSVLGNFYGAGCQGKVDGTVTSTLTACDVHGSAFGGGYKAAANEVDVYPITQPTYSVYTKETGLFSDFGTVAPETFTWQYRATTGSDDANKILYTTTDMTTLGNVTGAISLSIIGGTVGGDVFGGGNESRSRNNTSVTLSGALTVGGNVFGGGNRALVDGDAHVLIKD